MSSPAQGGAPAPGDPGQIGNAGTLYLVPAGLGCDNPGAVLPPSTATALGRLHRFYVENEKSARGFLKACGYPHPLREVRMAVIDEHTAATALPAMIAPLLAGEDWGLMSEAGCPAVADPGAELVRLAHGHGIRVVPLVGPSAILLALMASGLNGQHFEFHGYLPAGREERVRALRALEERTARTGATQAFIEAPYRNEALLRAMLECLRDGTELCVASDVSLPTESIRTRAVAEWRRAPPAVLRRPTVFLIGRSSGA